MRRCEEITELISADLDGELTQEQSKELYEHLESCGACMAIFLDLRILHDAMPDLTAPAPEGFADALMARLRAESGRTPGGLPDAKKRNIRWKAWGGLAAVLILTVLGAGRLILPGLGGAASGSTAASPAYDTAVSEKSAENYAGTMDTQPDQAPAPEAEAEAAQYGLASGSGSVEYSSTQSDGISGTGAAPDGEESRMLFAVGFAPETGDERGGMLTAVDAGYLILKAVDPDGFEFYQPSEEGGFLVFLAENGDAGLAYTGMIADGSRYEFVFTAPDGSQQHWSVAADGSSAGRN
jgi:hypothetical protein